MGEWFETVAVAQRRARKHLPKSVYGALVAGAEQGLTIGDNIEAFAELGFAPHVAGLPAAAGDGHHGDGPADLAAGADLADRGAGRAPGRRGRGGPGRRRARHGHGPVLVRQPSRSRRWSRPTRRRSSRCTGCGTRDEMAAADGAGPRRRARSA